MRGRLPPMRMIALVLLPSLFIGCGEDDEDRAQVEVIGLSAWCESYCVDRFTIGLSIEGQAGRVETAGCEDTFRFGDLTPGAPATLSLRGADAAGELVLEAADDLGTLVGDTVVETSALSAQLVAAPPRIAEVRVDDPSCEGFTITGEGFGDGGGDSSVVVDRGDTAPSVWRDDFICIEDATPLDSIRIRRCGIDSRTFPVQSYTCLCAGADLQVPGPGPNEGCTPRLQSAARVAEEDEVTLGIGCGARGGLTTFHFGGGLCDPAPSFSWFDTTGVPLDLDSGTAGLVWAAMGDAGLVSHDLSLERTAYDSVNAARVAVTPSRQFVVHVPLVDPPKLQSFSNSGDLSTLRPAQRDGVEYLDVVASSTCVVAGASDGGTGRLFSTKLEQTFIFSELDLGEACPGAASVALSDEWVVTTCGQDASSLSIVAIDEECGLDPDTVRTLRIDGADLAAVVIDGETVVALDAEFGLRIIDPSSGARGPDVPLPTGGSNVMAQWEDVLVVARIEAGQTRGMARLVSRIREGTPCR